MPGGVSRPFCPRPPIGTSGAMPCRGLCGDWLAGDPSPQSFAVPNRCFLGLQFCSGQRPMWVARRLGTGSSRHTFDLSLRQCQVLVSEPRLLAVRVKAPALSWLCVVAHAPHSKRPAEEREGWWRRTVELVVVLRQPADVLLVCLDSNSRIGRNPGTHWG